MKLAMHNLLMRLGSPAAHAIFLGLAIAFMSAFNIAKADSDDIAIVAIHSPESPASMKFHTEIGTDGFRTLPLSERTTFHTYSTAGSDDPAHTMHALWFELNLDKIAKPIQYAPTFIFWVRNPEIIEGNVIGGMREVGRLVGYSTREKFLTDVKAMLDRIEPLVGEDGRVHDQETFFNPSGL